MDEVAGTKNTARELALALMGSNILSLCIGGIYEYLSLSGHIPTKYAWVVLVFVWVLGTGGIVISEWMWNGNSPRRKLWAAIASVILALLLWGLHVGVSRVIKKPRSTIEQPCENTGNASTSGNSSPAIPGCGNTVIYDK